jgi:hypothetical protein
VTVTPQSHRARSVGAGLACFAAGALLMVMGESMHRLHRDTEATSAATSAPAVVPADTASVPQPVSQLGSYTAVRDDASSADARARSMQTQPAPAARRAPARGVITKRPAVSKTKQGLKEGLKQTSRPVPRVFPEPAPRGADRDRVLDRLRLKWLRERFTNADL